jgi:hypothetical protein
MAMSDADLNAVWGPSGLSEPYTLQRQNMYANMILSQWEMSYETRSLSDDHLPLLVREFLPQLSYQPRRIHRLRSG